MSVQSEINRISGNVSDALAATSEMGATVPSTANSNDLGDLIRAIPKVSVVQSTGSSTADVMSQAAVTTALNNLGIHYVSKDKFTVTAGSSTSGSYLAAKWSIPNAGGITTPFDGMTIAIRTPAAGYNGGILLSINGGATYYPIVRNTNTLVTTNYASGSTLILTFNSTQTASPYTTAGTTTSVTGCWQLADYDANTTYTNVKLGHGYCTCSTAAATVAKTASLSSYTLTTGGIVAVRFTNGITVANPTLNITSKGAKAIYYNGAALTDTSLIKAGDTVTFIYSSQYHIIAINRDTNTTYTFETGSANGQIKVTPSDGTAQNISVKGLGSAAYTESTAYATAAQGTLASNALPKSGGNVTGHIYLTGAKESSSTGNTSQIVFGTTNTNHVAISSNNNALVINPTSSSTTNQIVLYLDKPSQFPSGIAANLTGTPKAPTAAAGTNTTQIATTAFVKTAIDNALAGIIRAEGVEF